jgi:hypothetical protein
MAMSDATESNGSAAAQTGTNKESNVLAKYLFLPILASVVVSVIITNFTSPPSIQASAAHDFLRTYFRKVTNTNQRGTLYLTDLTSNFRDYPGVDRASYNRFWEKWKSVSVNSVIPVPGNPLEFAVTLTYQPKHGASFENDLDFWLVCTGLVGNVLAHVPHKGCPSGSIKIDNEQLAGKRQ